MTINNIDKMIELSKHKKKYLNEILKLTKEQKDFIKDDDMDGINNVISEKEKLMGSIDLLDLNFLTLYGEIRKLENIKSIDEINSIKYDNLDGLQEIIGNINLILTDISFMDKENTKIMKANLEDVKFELRNVKEVKKAYKGYNYEGVHSILYDEKK